MPRLCIQKVKWLQYAGEVSKCTRYCCQIFSVFYTPKSLKSFNFWQSYLRNKKVDVFFETQCILVCRTSAGMYAGRVYRNPGQLTDILRRYSSPVDTGLVAVQSGEVVERGRRSHQSATTIDALFFTRVHFDIFGLFFPRAIPGLGSATRLLMDVYGAENLTLCVASSELSSSSSSSSLLSPLSSSSSFGLLLNNRCVAAVTSSSDAEAQSTELFEEELTTLRRFSSAYNYILSYKMCSQRPVEILRNASCVRV